MSKEDLNGYNLSRAWFDFSFENPEKVKPIHTAMYFFAIEHCNRLGWKDKFGFPSTMVMEATGIKSYNTYINTFNDIVRFGFIKLIERSKNQYSSNIIGLSNFDKATNKALDKALIKHSTKQSESTVQSIDSIIKQITSKQITIEQLTKKEIDFLNKFLNPKKESKVNSKEFFTDKKINQLFLDYLKMRKEVIKKPASEKAIELAIEKIKNLAPNSDVMKMKILEQSIFNSWQGLFALKENYNETSRQNTEQPKRNDFKIIRGS